MASLKRTSVDNKGWLFYSEWFLPIVTSYLHFPTIKILDSVMIESQLKEHWLHCFIRGMKSIQLELESDCFWDVLSLIDWVVMRQIDLHELSIIAARDSWFTISNYNMKKLLENNKNLTKLCFNGLRYISKTLYVMNDKFLRYIALFCHNLKCFKFFCNEGFDDEDEEVNRRIS